MGKVIPDYDLVGEVYDSSQEPTELTPMERVYNELNIAIVALDWYAKNAYTHDTDFRRTAQEALRKIYKRKG
jgi:hypothetical protein